MDPITFKPTKEESEEIWKRIEEKKRKQYRELYIWSYLEQREIDRKFVRNLSLSLLPLAFRIGIKIATGR